MRHYIEYLFIFLYLQIKTFSLIIFIFLKVQEMFCNLIVQLFGCFFLDRILFSYVNVVWIPICSRVFKIHEIINRTISTRIRMVYLRWIQMIRTELTTTKTSFARERERGTGFPLSVSKLSLRTVLNLQTCSHT